jgi:ABC-2 type transport system ATP-binding protein
MKDVAALCKRVVIIAGGEIVHDGSLEGVIDRFSDHKILTLDFAEESVPGNLSKYGTVLEVAPPRARLQVDRGQIAAVLSTVLANHAIQDVSVEDPPLEDVIASLFTMTELHAPPGGDADAARAAKIAANGAASQAGVAPPSSSAVSDA